MGVDLLDITFRLERRFDLSMPYGAFLEEVLSGSGGRDVQVARFHEVVCRRLSAAGRPVPYSSWHRVQLAVVESIGVRVAEVRPESWLGKDLGCE